MRRHILQHRLFTGEGHLRHGGCRGGGLGFGSFGFGRFRGCLDRGSLLHGSCGLLLLFEGRFDVLCRRFRLGRRSCGGFRFGSRDWGHRLCAGGLLPACGHSFGCRLFCGFYGLFLAGLGPGCRNRVSGKCRDGRFPCVCAPKKINFCLTPAVHDQSHRPAHIPHVLGALVLAAQQCDQPVAELLPEQGCHPLLLQRQDFPYSIGIRLLDTQSGTLRLHRFHRLDKLLQPVRAGGDDPGLLELRRDPVDRLSGHELRQARLIRHAMPGLMLHRLHQLVEGGGRRDVHDNRAVGGGHAECAGFVLCRIRAFGRRRRLHVLVALHQHHVAAGGEHLGDPRGDFRPLLHVHLPPLLHLAHLLRALLSLLRRVERHGGEHAVPIAHGERRTFQRGGIVHRQPRLLIIDRGRAVLRLLRHIDREVGLDPLARPHPAVGIHRPLCGLGKHLAGIFEHPGELFAVGLIPIEPVERLRLLLV